MTNWTDSLDEKAVNATVFAVNNFGEGAGVVASPENLRFFAEAYARQCIEAALASGKVSDRFVDDVIGLTKDEAQAQATTKLLDARWDTAVKAAGGNDGIAYVLYGTVVGINHGMAPDRAFAASAEDQNFYGSRPDIRAVREQAARILKAHYGVAVDPHTCWKHG